VAFPHRDARDGTAFTFKTHHVLRITVVDGQMNDGRYGGRGARGAEGWTSGAAERVGPEGGGAEVLGRRVDGRAMQWRSGRRRMSGRAEAAELGSAARVSVAGRRRDFANFGAHVASSLILYDYKRLACLPKIKKKTFKISSPIESYNICTEH